MRFTIGRKLTLGFSSILLLTVALAGGVLFELKDVRDQYTYVIEHDGPVIANAQELSKLVVDMETGQRGFVITGNEEFLEPYNQATSRFSSLMAMEKQLVVDNPSQVQLLERIEASVSEWRNVAALPEIEMRRQISEANFTAEQLQDVLSEGVGKGILDEIREVTAEIGEALRRDGNLEALVLLKSIEKSVVDRETGQRGFLITGQEEFLEPYLIGQRELVRQFYDLEELVDRAHDRQATYEDVNELEKLQAKWLYEIVDPEIELKRQATDGAITEQELSDSISATSGKQLLDEIRVVLDRMERRFLDAKNERLATLTLQAGKAIVDQETGHRGFLLSGRGEFLEPYFLGKEHWLNAIEGLRELNSKSYDIDKMTSNLALLRSLCDEWIAMAAEPEITARREINASPESLSDVAIMLEEGSGKRILDRIRSQFDAFIQEEQSLSRARIEKANAASHRTISLALWISLLAIVVVLSIASLLTRRITKPMRRLTDALKQVGQGKTGVSVPVTSHDETGELAIAFNRMLGDLRRLDADRHDAQIELSASVEYTQKILRSINDMLIVVNPAGRIEKVNQATCDKLGYAEDDLIGRPASVLFGHTACGEPIDSKGSSAELLLLRDILPLDMHALTTLATKGAASDVERALHRNGDGAMPVVISCSLVKNDAGSISGIVCIARDITQRLESDRRLLEAKRAADNANRSKSDFLANMSHEIRTPMTAILGFAENLLDAELSDDEKLGCVHTIRRNGEYLLGIINDILDLSKIEAGKMTVEDHECEVCSIIAEVTSLMGVRADTKGIKLETVYEGSIPDRIGSDPVRIRQILINLIGNAIKFTEQGSVRLITRMASNGNGKRLEFDVVDTGCGMTEQQKDRLFKPFTQADTSTSRKFGGTGLGLSISKRFAELLGGDLEVVKTSEGLGSTFRATIVPSIPEDVKMLDDPKVAAIVKSEQTAVASVNEKPLLGLRLLLAEDGFDNQRLISFVLSRAGARTKIVENGQLAVSEALSAVGRGEPFNVILMDMQMPVMDGYTAATELRSRDYTGKIIALTAHAMESDRKKCIDAGCDDYATKPVDRAKLVSMIQELATPSEEVSATGF